MNFQCQYLAKDNMDSNKNKGDTVKPVLRAFRTKRKWSFKTGDLLKEVQLI
jgi:hypothetical protein